MFAPPLPIGVFADRVAASASPLDSSALAVTATTAQMRRSRSLLVRLIKTPWPFERRS